MRIFSAGLINFVVWNLFINGIYALTHSWNTIDLNNIQGYVFMGVTFSCGAISQMIKQIKEKGDEE